MSKNKLSKLILVTALLSVMFVVAAIPSAMGKYVTTITGQASLSEFVTSLINNQFSLHVANINATYGRGETIDPVVTLKYTDGRADKTLSASEYNVLGMDTSTPGIKTMTISHTDPESGKVVSSVASYKVIAVTGIAVEVLQDVFNINETPKKEDFLVTAVNNEGEAEQVYDFQIQVQGDLSTAGDKTVTISYTENDITYTANCTIRVENITILEVKNKLQMTNYDGSYHRMWWFHPGNFNVSGWSQQVVTGAGYETYLGTTYQAPNGEVVTGFNNDWAVGDTWRQDGTAPQGLEFFNADGRYDLTITNARSYTTVGINCFVGYDAAPIGFGCYVDGNPETLRYTAPAMQPSLVEIYGPNAAAAVFSISLHEFAFEPGSTHVIQWVAVFSDGIQKISEWTITMAETSNDVFVDTDKQNVNVIILAGQSNACGPAPISQELRNTYGNMIFPNVFMHYTNIEVVGTTSIHHFANEGFDMYQLGYGAWGAEYFGPELGLANYLATSESTKNEQWYIIKYAATGTTLNGQWVNGGHLGAEMIDYVKDAIDMLDDTYDVQVRSFLWMQGENDASNESWANSYALYEQQLVELVRTELAAYSTRAADLVTVPGSGISFVNAGIAHNTNGIGYEQGGPNNWYYASTVNNFKYLNCAWWYLPTTTVEGSVFMPGIASEYYQNVSQVPANVNSVYIDTAALYSKAAASEAEKATYPTETDKVDWAHYSTDSMFSLGTWFAQAMDYMRAFG